MNTWRRSGGMGRGCPSGLTVLSLTTCLLAGCRGSVEQRAVTQPLEAPMSPVPAQAPGTLPAWTQDDSSYAGIWLKGVLMIRFEDSATVAHRMAIITSFGGTVIGGTQSAGAEGNYYVLLPGNPTVEAADSIATLVQVDPRVRLAGIAVRGGSAYPGFDGQPDTARP